MQNLVFYIEVLLFFACIVVKIEIAGINAKYFLWLNNFRKWEKDLFIALARTEEKRKTHSLSFKEKSANTGRCRS